MLWILTIGAVAVAVAVGGVVLRGSRPAAATPIVRLFADDVALETLPLSLSIETAGGVSTMVVPRGTPLPTAHRETFGTAADNQRSIEVHVLVGDRTRAAANMSLGRFAIIKDRARPGRRVLVHGRARG